MEEKKSLPKGLPYCMKCNQKHDYQEKIPLLLSCGNSFCKACLTKEMQEQ